MRASKSEGVGLAANEEDAAGNLEFSGGKDEFSIRKPANARPMSWLQPILDAG